MDFSLTDEQQMLKDSVERFVADNYSPDQRAKIIAGDDGFSPEHWQQFAELGWLTIPFAEQAGGFGGGIVETAAVMEPFGSALVVEPFLQTVLLGGQALARGANTDEQRGILSGVMAGDTHLALAWQERQSRSDWDYVDCRAEKTASGYTLKGDKVLVSNAPAADYLVLSARTSGEALDEQGISLFLIDAKDTGIQGTGFALMDGQRVANLRFDGLEVPADALLAEEGAGSTILAPLMDEARVAVCAEAVGAMDYLYKATVEYSGTRKQFGQPIGKFQVLQHRMVDMYMQTEQCRSLLIRALCAITDDSDSRARDIAALKAMVGKYGRRVAEEAVQIHGAMGVTLEMPIGHYLRRLMMIDASFGNADYHRRRFCDLSYSGDKPGLALAS